MRTIIKTALTGTGQMAGWWDVPLDVRLSVYHQARKIHIKGRIGDHLLRKAAPRKSFFGADEVTLQLNNGKQMILWQNSVWYMADMARNTSIYSPTLCVKLEPHSHGMAIDGETLVYVKIYLYNAHAMDATGFSWYTNMHSGG